MGFPDGSVVKNPSVNAEDAGDASSIPGSGKKWHPTPEFLLGKFHW